jgi:hypothetical protein
MGYHIALLQWTGYICCNYCKLIKSINYYSNTYKRLLMIFEGSQKLSHDLIGSDNLIYIIDWINPHH